MIFSHPVADTPPVLFLTAKLISVFQNFIAAAWGNLFWLIIIFLVMLVLNRWITIHIQYVGMLLSGSEVAATWLYFFLFIPGILIHEISHFLVAWVLRARPSKLVLWPTVKRGRVVLGSVQVHNTDPLSHSIIGAAPLLFGSLAVWFLARFLQFDQLGEAITAGNMPELINAAGRSLATPDFWLWIYLLFAISNAMLPSPVDRIYWAPILLFLGSGFVLLLGLDLLPAIPPNIQNGFANIISVLVFALTTVVAVNLFFFFFIFVLESLLTIATGRKVRY
jgi:hypothetical protein